MSLPEDMGSFDALVWVVARLRAPDGCPWDRVQSHATLRRYLLSECYEVLEALDEADPGKLRAELGDLLMQVVIHARIAQETGEFELADVIRGISTKLIRRHPHVFGSTRVGSEEEVYLNWEELKREERGADASILESVPGELPALGYAQEIQDRVARVGFDWADISGVIDKLGEEVEEFRRAADAAEKAAEFGDLLFTLVNIGRRLGIDAESALRQANRRFYRRFAYMERLCRERGVRIGDLSLDEQNRLWEEAKQKA